LWPYPNYAWCLLNEVECTASGPTCEDEPRTTLAISPGRAPRAECIDVIDVGYSWPPPTVGRSGFSVRKSGWKKRCSQFVLLL